MARALAFSDTVNPYARWIYDHPACLLPHPTPERLSERMAPLAASGAGIVVDLGCGSGNFLLQLALAGREAGGGPRGYVGFELRYKRLVKAARKLERAGLDNVWLVRESAERFAEYFAPASVEAVHVNFPDPWPKQRQWKKRLVSPALLEAVERVLRPGGCLHLKTDHSGYFLHVLSLVRGRPGLRLRAFANDIHRSPLPGPAAGTEFEALFRSKGRAVFALVMEKAPPTG